MKTIDLDRLEKEKDAPCVSIILETDRTDKATNLQRLKKMVQKAQASLENKDYPEDTKRSLMVKMAGVTQMLPDSVEEGLGIYLSPRHSLVCTFPFTVNQKVVVGQRFELRDLYYLRQYITPYYIINLSKHGVELFVATAGDLEEIKDGNFPFVFKDEFEYERASIADSSSGSLKGFEKEKNQISEERLKAVFREADTHLKPYLKTDASRLLLSGTQKSISSFLGLTSLKKHIFGKVSGSYSSKNLDKLAQAAWTEFVRNKKKEIDQAIRKLHELPPKQLAEGTRPVWKAALEGKGQTLFVEKDFHLKVFRKPDQSEILLQPPKKPYKIMTDIVDDLIEMVTAKNGTVLFTENGQLKAKDHLALVLRY